MTATKLVGTTILERIGNTPLVRLDELTRDLPGVQILGKAEWVNPGGSVKDRAAAGIVNDAVRRGLIKPGDRSGKGLIDPCPLWDDDGKAYLVNAFAGSRAGYKSVLAVSKMSTDGTKLLDNGVMVFDGHEAHPTVEGPKFYKRNGYYYIFAPAGGVATGWELVLRSKNIYGPYEEKIALAKGKSPINGPHQGGWVDTPGGEDPTLYDVFVSPTPAGRNSEPYQERRVCAGNTNCIPICPIQAKWDPTVTLGQALDTGNVTMSYQSVAYNVAVEGENDAQKATRIDYYVWSRDESGAISKVSKSVTAKVYVLACHAIENAKTKGWQREDGALRGKADIRQVC